MRQGRFCAVSLHSAIIHLMTAFWEQDGGANNFPTTEVGALHVDHSYSSCLSHASVYASDSAAVLIL